MTTIRPVSEYDLTIVAPRRLDIITAPQLEREVELTLARTSRPGARITIDLRGTSVADSSGLGALIQARALAARAMCSIRLRSVPDDLRIMLVLTGLDDIFEVES